MEVTQLLVNELCLRQVKKMQKAENLLKGYLSYNIRKGFFAEGKKLFRRCERKNEKK